ncbi:MAG: 3-hydroxyacyl-CoA dehydrogenase family protein [Hyphomicrobiaceae bacterium]
MAGGERIPVAVIGNGIIGHGVAQIFAAAGHPVVMIGRNADSLQRALGNIRSSLEEFAENGLTDAAGVTAALQRIRTSTSLQDAGGAGLVVEAVTEDLPLKLGIFEELDRICPASTILGSSSGQPASALVPRVKHRARVIATHFWYPPQLIPLVEVCAGPETDPEVTRRTVALIRAAGKEPVVIDKEVPGFIGNRIQFAALREAWSLWAAGVASAEAIDTVVKASIGRRLGITGPIESADVGGLDTLYNFARFLQPHLDRSADPPEAVGRIVAEGQRGPSTGRGVYDWTKRDGDRLLKARRAELFRWLKADRDGQS